MSSDVPTDFSHLLEMLSTPEAFPDAACKETQLSMIQTHASAVIRTPGRVYKLKKPKNFGFFDYSTSELRRHFCIQEVLLNAPLAPGVYLGVAPVIQYADDRWQFGPVFVANDVPMPGQNLLGGKVCDFAVVMVRLPDEATLEARIHANTATPLLLAEIAQAIATFHKTTPTSESIAKFGQLDVVRGNWEENFRQMEPFVGRTLDRATYDQIREYVRAFLAHRAPLLAGRIRDGHIRDCHGDLRLQHVYILNSSPEQGTSRQALLDRIEFNERFRYGDVAGEIAFLTMELDAACRADLAQTFVNSYVAETGDETLREMLPFYACYRACVRGKVASFQLDEAEIAEPQRKEAQSSAEQLFAQAASYAQGLTQPAVLLLGGLMGTGKSTIAQALRQQLGWALFSSDSIRKQLAHLDPTKPQADAFNQGLYSSAWTAQTYAALREHTATLLAESRSVILDASFLRRADRQALEHIATSSGAKVLFVECVCPREIALWRLAQRWRIRQESSGHSLASTSFASDGRPDLYDAQSTLQETFAAQEEAGVRHIQIPTTSPLPVCIEQILETLTFPRLMSSFSFPEQHEEAE
jgi:aminoglycoside phosphotransferase family enzyme/predicted kinase